MMRKTYISLSLELFPGFALAKTTPITVVDNTAKKAHKEVEKFNNNWLNNNQ
jgi:hypothetical protein